MSEAGIQPERLDPAKWLRAEVRHAQVSRRCSTGGCGGKSMVTVYSRTPYGLPPKRQRRNFCLRCNYRLPPKLRAQGPLIGDVDAD